MATITNRVFESLARKERPVHSVQALIDSNDHTNNGRLPQMSMYLIAGNAPTKSKAPAPMEA